MSRIVQASQNKDGEPPQATFTDLTELSRYEINRLSNMAKIKARLRTIGLESSRGKSSRLSAQRKRKSSAVYIYIYIYMYIVMLRTVG
jgi:hypothetical protein